MPEVTQTPDTLKADTTLDAKGLNCPLPVLKTKVALNRMAPGQMLKVEATDPHARIDFEAYCARSGHTLLRIDEIDDVLCFYIRCAERAVSD